MKKERRHITFILLSICLFLSSVSFDSYGASNNDLKYKRAMSSYNSFLEKMETGGSDGEWYFNVEEYALYDLNKDGIPELITHGGGSSDYAKIYTCYEGYVQNVHWGSSFNIYSNGIVEYSFNSGSGYWTDTFYKLNNNLYFEYVYRYTEWLYDDPETFSEGEYSYDEDSERVEYSLIQEHKANVLEGSSVVKLDYYKNTSTNRAKQFGSYITDFSDILGIVQNTKATEYNADLAYELMVASNKAYGENDGKDEGSVIKAYLQNIGIENVQKYNYYKNKYDSRYKRDSVAYSIGYNDTDNGRIVTIVIRGSFGSIWDMTPDWKSNLHLNEKLLGVQGWHHGFEIPSEEILNKLKERGLLKTDGTKYIITGHSRGGGVGNLLAVRLSDAGVSKEDVFNYNFACPDTNRGWPTDWNWNGAHDNIFNIGYCGDPVTMLPGLAGDLNLGTTVGLTWGKYGRSVWYADDWKNFETADWSFDAHDGSNYIRFLSTKPAYSYFRSWNQMNVSQVTNRIKGVLSVFSCPVDVYAKNNKGEVLASIINNEISYSNKNDGSVCVVTYGDKKCFFVMDGESINYELIGTDAGTMTANAFYINKLAGEEKDLMTFSDVKLEKGKQFVLRATIDKQNLFIIDDKGIIKKTVKPDGSEVSVDLSDAEVIIKDCAYNGKNQKPIAEISIDGNALNSDSYSISYKNSKNVGAATATITGRNLYTGKKTVSFKIIPKSTTIRKPKSEKKAITVKWKKQSAKMSKKHITGYQIQYSTDKSFKKGSKTKKIKGYKKTSAKVKKLKTKKKYYIRIRTYMSVGGKTYYSKWSKCKSIKTK